MPEARPPAAGARGRRRTAPTGTRAAPRVRPRRRTQHSDAAADKRARQRVGTKARSLAVHWWRSRAAAGTPEAAPGRSVIAGMAAPPEAETESLARTAGPPTGT